MAISKAVVTGYSCQSCGEQAYIEWDEPLAPPAKEADKLRPVYAPSALSPLPLLLSGRSGWKRSQPPH
jgi:hypothetical protein